MCVRSLLRLITDTTTDSLCLCQSPGVYWHFMRVHINKCIVKSSRIVSIHFGGCAFLCMKHVTAEVKAIVNLIWSKSYVCTVHRTPCPLPPNHLPNVYSIYSQIKDFRLWIWSTHKYYARHCCMCIETNITLHAYHPTQTRILFIYYIVCTVTKVLISSCMQFRCHTPTFFSSSILLWISRNGCQFDWMSQCGLTLTLTLWSTLNSKASVWI